MAETTATDETGSANGGMFTGAPQHDAFPLLNNVFPSIAMPPATNPFRFPDGDPLSLPDAYVFRGARHSTEGFFADTDTVAMLVIRHGLVHFERYALTGGPDVPWISWSVAKSFVSALIGIAIDEGHIASVEDPISNYVPFMTGSAYDGVRIKDVLQMSSGAEWNEDYADPDSDINRLGIALSPDGSFDQLVASMRPQREPGTFCQYNSGDTQALGSLLVTATGRSISDYMQEKLIEPLGMESTGYWLRDSVGMDMAFGGLMLTARDFAKLGELYRNGGVADSKQVVPADWVRDSVRADASHLQPSSILGHDNLPFGYGYGYQWWLGPGDRGDYTAIGVYNQFIYVDPGTNVVIVKLSANRTYGLTATEASDREAETLDFFRAIADHADVQ